MKPAKPEPAKTRFERITLVILAVFVVGVGAVSWLGYSFLSPHSARNQASALGCILSWGRLASFPASAQRNAISVEGSSFTRAFRTTFTASPADIELWLQESSGTREALPTKPSPGTRHFEIVPGEGAVHAEVNVDDTRHSVSIYVYWS